MNTGRCFCRFDVDIDWGNLFGSTRVTVVQDAAQLKIKFIRQLIFIEHLSVQPALCFAFAIPTPGAFVFADLNGAGAGFASDAGVT